MNEPEKIVGASEPVPGGPIEGEAPSPPPPAPGQPIPFVGEMTYQQFLASGSHIPTPAELALPVDGSEGGPFDPLQTTYTVLNIGSVIVQVDGTPISVPIPSGTTTEPGSPVFFDDFANLVVGTTGATTTTTPPASTMPPTQTTAPPSPPQ